MTIRIFLLLSVVILIKGIPFSYTAKTKEDVNVIGKHFSDIIEKYIYDYNGRFAGDISYEEGEFDLRYVKNSEVYPYIHRSLKYFACSDYQGKIKRVSLIVEFNRVHLFVLDENFDIIGHVVAHSDGVFIGPNSGPRWRERDLLNDEKEKTQSEASEG